MIATLPLELRKSITWDRGSEMAQHARFTIESGIPIYFCDPQSPWQRGTNENTNGLLRQYWPKGADLRHLTMAECDRVALSLNTRPRKTLDSADSRTGPQPEARCINRLIRGSPQPAPASGFSNTCSIE